MARLVAAFGSSHSPMLASRVEDWQGGFLARDRHASSSISTAMVRLR